MGHFLLNIPKLLRKSKYLLRKMVIRTNKNYRPLPNNLTIKKSSIDGLGVFATDNIDKGTNLGISHVHHIDYEDDYIRTPLGGFLNHSEKPNCDIYNDIGDLYIITSKNIKKGEELTIKYTLYDPTI